MSVTFEEKRTDGDCAHKFNLKAVVKVGIEFLLLQHPKYTGIHSKVQMWDFNCEIYFKSA